MSGQIQDGAKMFVREEGQNLHRAKTTLHTVYSFTPYKISPYPIQHLPHSSLFPILTQKSPYPFNTNSTLSMSHQTLYFNSIQNSSHYMAIYISINTNHPPLLISIQNSLYPTSLLSTRVQDKHCHYTSVQWLASGPIDTYYCPGIFSGHWSYTLHPFSAPPHHRLRNTRKQHQN